MLFHTVPKDGPHERLTGDISGLTGDCTGITGDCTGLYGDCSGLTGDCSDLWGDCTGITGDCTGLTGNCTGLHGDCTGLTGNVSGLRGDCTGLAGNCTGLTGNIRQVLAAEKHGAVADGIEEELAYNIFSDDPDAVERLEARIAELEAEAEMSDGPRHRNIWAYIHRLEKRLPEARVYAQVREGESRCAARGQEDRAAGRTLMTPAELVAWAAGEKLIRPDAEPDGPLATRYYRAYMADDA